MALPYSPTWIPDGHIPPNSERHTGVRGQVSITSSKTSFHQLPSTAAPPAALNPRRTCR